MDEDNLKIAKSTFSSRLLVGTGKYKNEDEAKEAIQVSGAEIVTVAIRRVDFSNLKNSSILDYLPPEEFTILPNTAGSYTAEEAVRMARLGKEMLEGNSFVKLEVLKDPHTLLPNMDATVEAAKILTKEGFDVMVYCTDEYEYAIKLQEIGCASIMPLASPIGSGLGLVSPDKIQKIIEDISVPVIVDAGIGTASDVVIAMEMGADAVLLNSAIAYAENPIKMARAMKLATISGRESYLSGRMEKSQGKASSPNEGIIGT